MPIQIIGKSILGKLGFCQNYAKMEENYYSQLSLIENTLLKSFEYMDVIMTSMTGSKEIEETGGKYFPKIREYHCSIHEIFNAYTVYEYCITGKDILRPGADFIIWDENDDITVTTFSREAPILAFESSSGKKALGVILRPSLMEYGDYLFNTIAEALKGEITVNLVTCNHYQYPEGSIPSVIKDLAGKYGMNCIIGIDSEKNPECYHRGEFGNHVVAMW